MVRACTEKLPYLLCHNSNQAKLLGQSSIKWRLQPRRSLVDDTRASTHPIKWQGSLPTTAQRIASLPSLSQQRVAQAGRHIEQCQDLGA
eukprot:CAMPEP_0170297576 /NCGR_PEP_ID=MMETSP0116_2-20130129/48949_1 /TAXON_ID=400756 /ORGANISM="Durinskia baltica, Strain CSIRO CS-38" /LENGTH=88 /DNA_ID=CAMNT_0010549201 /DNA_START=27 /DNA_END=290 /DNA_ORIENTATION=+